jgi:hypothetical protein
MYSTMDHINRIMVIEQRAKVLGFSMCGVCRRAKVPRHYISRWRTNRVSPTVRCLNLHLGRLEKWLTAAEAIAEQEREPERLAS